MSVAAYVREANLGIQREIQKRLDYANSHPYPTDELKEASKNKKKYKGYQLAIADLFGIYSPNGQIGDDPNTLDPEKLNAIKEGAEKISPGLWTRLQEGQAGLNKKAEIEEYLKNINPEAEITEEFDKFYSAILKKQKADPKITFDQVFAIEDDLFVDLLGINPYNLYIRLNSYGADGLVKAAFKELYDKKKSSAKVSTTEKPKPASSSPINEKPKTEVSTQEKTQNQGESTINEKPKNEITENKSSTQAKSEGTINEKTASTKEPTNVTSSEGALTSKKVEVTEEKPKIEEKQNPAININIENNKPTKSIESTKEPAGSFFNMSGGSTVNTTESSTSTTNNNPSTTSLININENKNENNQRSEINYSTSEKEEGRKRGGFLSKVGKIVSKAGDFLNLPSTGELGQQAKELFGVTTSNFESRVSEVKKSFSENSLNLEKDKSIPGERRGSGTSLKTSRENKETYFNNLNSSNIEKSENFSKVNSENSSMIKMEETKPSMVKETTMVKTEPIASTTSSSSTANTNTASNTTISQSSNTTQPSPNTVSQQQSSSQNQPVIVDLNQLAQSINRVERILMSGIEVTLKES